ncbi:molybdate ABC transporter permease subunit [Alkalilimnicola ehrlichii MLHE-1]|uniref:Molybdenum transport system permease n=1 Tax=Alkalilimnicola ehrlichii (strain ATCC BAA-1101 / DSM 17681 / MLHE-1) TaxID=187272 RepID=Q0A7C1_ALKEH|nr:molybdate ABC transporter permease subunit [Alkalilimnicola ehrlichii]ABI57266.1 molybdate ABC transporter, inner membrane subunit [Alkalilimnicola ehrlichii MLHE-1]
MDWEALEVSLWLAFWTCVVLTPVGIIVARQLAWRRFRGRGFAEALVALPLVLPPTVLGFYLLVAFGSDWPIGQFWQWLTGGTLVFTFEGILIASIIFNLPFAVQPLQRAFEAIPHEVREAAWCSGLSTWQTFWRVELPLAWPGLISAVALTFAHTLGEFGVVLMVGGSISGETKTIAIAIYDRVQAFDEAAAGNMSVLLLLISFITIGIVYGLAGRRRGVRV